MTADLVSEIKTRLAVTGNYHDALLAAYAEDVKAFLVDGGVPAEVVESDEAVGCIARGVADLWDYGSGEGKFSPVFLQRAAQMAVRREERCRPWPSAAS